MTNDNVFTGLLEGGLGTQSRLCEILGFRKHSLNIVQSVDIPPKGCLETGQHNPTFYKLNIKVILTIYDVKHRWISFA